MDKLKYIGLMCIPLVYYIFPLQGYSGDILFPLLISFPVAFSILYVLLFSATKQVGAVLWSASNPVYDIRVRRYILISAIGMALLFGSIDITPMQYRTYPPYGLITEALTPLGSYLLLIGILVSAKQISQSAQIRRVSQKRFKSVRTIGITQMEKEFEDKVKSFEKHPMLLEKKDEPYLEEQEVREILHEVLEELHGKVK